MARINCEIKLTKCTKDYLHYNDLYEKTEGLVSYYKIKDKVYKVVLISYVSVTVQIKTCDLSNFWTKIMDLHGLPSIERTSVCNVIGEYETIYGLLDSNLIDQERAYQLDKWTDTNCHIENEDDDGSDYCIRMHWDPNNTTDHINSHIVSFFTTKQIESID